MNCVYLVLAEIMSKHESYMKWIYFILTGIMSKPESYMNCVYLVLVELLPKQAWKLHELCILSSSRDLV